MVIDVGKRLRIKSLIYVSLGAVLITLCSWIYIPLPVPFTFQLFAVFTVSAILGVKKSLTAVLVYVLLGIVGLPVFSGFKGGLGALFSSTGGYTLGFFAVCLITGYSTVKFGRKTSVMILSMYVSLVLCYISGTVWFTLLYAETEDVFNVLKICVLPFIIPDTVKILLASLTVKRIYSVIK